jgi:hypothetical protein
MNKYLVSYATIEFAKSQKRLHKSALKFGINRIKSYTPAQIRRTQFYRQNKQLLSYPRGAGYYAWKPYIILETLKVLEEGDLLIYSDSGIEIINDISPLIELCYQEKGVLIFKNDGFANSTWTKRDCFVLMGCDSEPYHSANQVVAGFIVLIKNQKSLSLIEEWLYYCQQINVISDLPNICSLDNFPDFKDHRHDQSILSLLTVKHRLNTFRDPSQWGNHKKMKEFREMDEFLPCPTYSELPCLNSPYATLLDIHRERSEHPVARVKRISLQYFGIDIRRLFE